MSLFTIRIFAQKLQTTHVSIDVFICFDTIVDLIGVGLLAYNCVNDVFNAIGLFAQKLQTSREIMLK